MQLGCHPVAVHIYTQTINRIIQNKQYIEQHNNFGRIQQFWKNTTILEEYDNFGRIMVVLFGTEDRTFIAVEIDWLYKTENLLKYK